MNIKMIHRKETLVITAVSIIHEKGFQGLSTREVAAREGISEATIFKHFKTKNDLLLAVLEHFFQFDEVLLESAYHKEMTPKERLLHVLQGLVTYYENYPEITAILQSYGSLIHEEDLKEKVLEIFSKRTRTIQIFIDQGKEFGEIDSTVPSEILVDMILGAFDRIILRWRIQNYDFSLKECTLSTINQIFHSIAPVIRK